MKLRETRLDWAKCLPPRLRNGRRSRAASWRRSFPVCAGGISRADLDGSNVDEDFITPTHATGGYLAVDGLTDHERPGTKLTKGAPSRTTKTHVSFKFKSSEPDSTFECKFDNKHWKPCESPKRLDGLKGGRHKFKVRAIDAAQNVDPTPAKDEFKVV